MKNILITGCSGFAGIHVTERLSKAGYQLIGLDVKAPKKKIENLFFLQVDLSDSNQLALALAIVKERFGDCITTVLHLVDYESFSKGFQEKYEKVHIQATQNLVEHLKQFRVDQLIVTSTLFVHEAQNKINEMSPKTQKGEFTSFKLASEEIILKNKGETSIVILRIPDLYNEHHLPRALDYQIRNIREKSPLSYLYPGNQKNGVPYLHVEDLVDLISLLIEKRTSLPKKWIAVIGEEETLSVEELQNTMSGLIHNQPMKVFSVPKQLLLMLLWINNALPFKSFSYTMPWRLELADGLYQIDLQPVNEILPFKPQHSLKNTLPFTLCIQKNNNMR